MATKSNNMKELQTRRFKEQIQEIIPGNFSQNLKFNNDVVTEAKVNITTKLSFVQIKCLMAMAQSWYFNNIEISRSGAGLKIEFTEFSEQPQEVIANGCDIPAPNKG